MISTKKRASKAHSYMKKLGLAFLLIFAQLHSVYANTAVDGWNFGNPISNGATTTWNATKDVAGKVVTGVASIKPTPAQVAKGILKGGLIGIALTAAEQLLEDGVDFVLDPANNQIRYKSKSDYYYVTNGSEPFAKFSTPELACNYFNKEYYTNYKVTITSDKENCYVEPYGPYAQIHNDLKGNEQIISLQSIGSGILNQAEAGNKEAQDYINTVAQDLLEHDEDVQKAVVAQADDSQKDSENQPVSVPSTSGNSTNATPPPDDENEQEIAKKSNDETAKEKIENLKNSGKFNEEFSNATTKIYDKQGGLAQANKDFDSLGLKNIRTIPRPEGEIRLGQLENDVMVNVRSFSTRDGRSTLEIRVKKPIKIRYD